MKLTLLEYVQDILNDMDSDYVNSISDTTESEQVANIVKTTYYALLSNRNWPHTKRNIQITPSGDPALPTHMSLQSNIKELVSVHYNCVREGETRRLYRPMKWVENDAFLRKSLQLNNDESNVDIIVDASGIELLIRNDIPPTCYTSFDDTNLVFDSYDSAVDDTLMGSKVQAIAYVFPDWTHEDTFIPDLPEEAVTVLLESAKSKAMFKLKQMVDVMAGAEASKQQRWLSRKAWRAHGGIVYPNYGRRGRKGDSSIYFEKNDPTP